MGSFLTLRLVVCGSRYELASDIGFEVDAAVKSGVLYISCFVGFPGHVRHLAEASLPRDAIAIPHLAMMWFPDTPW